MMTMLWLPRPDRLDFDTGGNMALGYSSTSVNYRKVSEALRREADHLESWASKIETDEDLNA